MKEMKLNKVVHVPLKPPVPLYCVIIIFWTHCHQIQSWKQGNQGTGKELIMSMWQIKAPSHFRMFDVLIFEPLYGYFRRSEDHRGINGDLKIEAKICH